jgi:N-acetylmuramoyl-L-alanine amidase
MKKSLFIIGMVLLAALLLSGGVYLLAMYLEPLSHTILTDDSVNVKENDEIFAKSEQRPTIILDAGHGGEDSGAVGVDGVLEKDLNLALAFRLRDLLRFEGWRVILTRDSDILLYDPKVELSHKVQDLKNRLNFGSVYPDSVFVSIHMNRFPAESCKGLQIYYSPNHPVSGSLAERLQSDVKNYVDPANHRLSKKATTSIFILHRIQNPAILIECGFISNYEEASMLQNDSYQKKLTAVISAGLYNHFRLLEAEHNVE